MNTIIRKITLALSCDYFLIKFNSVLSLKLNSNFYLEKTLIWHYFNSACLIKFFSCKRMFTTAQKMKFLIKDFFSKCDQTHRSLRIWLHLLKKSPMENFIFCAVEVTIIWIHFFVYNISYKESSLWESLASKPLKMKNMSRIMLPLRTAILALLYIF